MSYEVSLQIPNDLHETEFPRVDEVFFVNPGTFGEPFELFKEVDENSHVLFINTAAVSWIKIGDS